MLPWQPLYKAALWQKKWGLCLNWPRRDVNLICQFQCILCRCKESLLDWKDLIKLSNTSRIWALLYQLHTLYKVAGGSSWFHVTLPPGRPGSMSRFLLDDLVPCHTSSLKTWFHVTLPPGRLDSMSHFLLDDLIPCHSSSWTTWFHVTLPPGRPGSMSHFLLDDLVPCHTSSWKTWFHVSHFLLDDLVPCHTSSWTTWLHVTLPLGRPGSMSHFLLDDLVPCHTSSWKTWFHVTLPPGRPGSMSHFLLDDLVPCHTSSWTTWTGQPLPLEMSRVVAMFQTALTGHQFSPLHKNVSNIYIY